MSAAGSAPSIPPTASAASPPGSRPTSPSLVLPAWDEFLEHRRRAGPGRPDPPRRAGRRATSACTWAPGRAAGPPPDAGRGGARRHRREADWSDHRRPSTRTRTTRPCSRRTAGAPRAEVLAALQRGAGRGRPTFLGRPGGRRARPPAGALGARAAAAADPGRCRRLRAGGARPRPRPGRCAGRRPSLLSAGLAALVDITGALAARCGISTPARLRLARGRLGVRQPCPAPGPTLELPVVPPAWPAVEGRAAVLLDASAGRRAVPAMLARRELRLHHVGGLLALAPIVEAVPGPARRRALRRRCATCAGSAGWSAGCRASRAERPAGRRC